MLTILGSEKALYNYLCENIKDNEEFFISNIELGKRLHVTAQTIAEHRRKLVEMGLIINQFSLEFIRKNCLDDNIIVYKSVWRDKVKGIAYVKS